jgi:hypothetical protein
MKTVAQFLWKLIQLAPSTVLPFNIILFSAAIQQVARVKQTSGSCAKITGLFTQGAILRKDNESTQQVDLD